MYQILKRNCYPNHIYGEWELVESYDSYEDAVINKPLDEYEYDHVIVEYKIF